MAMSSNVFTIAAHCCFNRNCRSGSNGQQSSLSGRQAPRRHATGASLSSSRPASCAPALPPSQRGCDCLVNWRANMSEAVRVSASAPSSKTRHMSMLFCSCAAATAAPYCSISWQIRARPHARTCAAPAEDPALRRAHLRTRLVVVDSTAHLDGAARTTCLRRPAP